MRRIFYLVIGWFFVALAFAGVVLPVLPTTPFLIVAMGCFARSSPRLEAWLLSHPSFGPVLTDWRTHGAIPRRAKMFAYSGMSAGYVFFWVASSPGWPLAAGVAALMASGAAYVATRPLPPGPATDADDDPKDPPPA